jgi:hypothetical protein
VSSYGIFAPLFGLPSNEIYWVTCSQEGTENLLLPEGIATIATSQFVPTIRPTEHSQRTRPGVYVFRWFKVAPDSVNEIVRLSGEAWPGFEGSFDTEIQGLFVENGEEPSNMLLITWYRNLSVWEASRHPPPDARENFLKRHQLTLSALPIATTLMLPSSGTKLVSHS